MHARESRARVPGRAVTMEQLAQFVSQSFEGPASLVTVPTRSRVFKSSHQQESLQQHQQQQEQPRRLQAAITLSVAQLVGATVAAAANTTKSECDGAVDTGQIDVELEEVAETRDSTFIVDLLVAVCMCLHDFGSRMRNF